MDTQRLLDAVSGSNLPMAERRAIAKILFLAKPNTFARLYAKGEELATENGHWRGQDYDDACNSAGDAILDILDGVEK